MRTLFFRDLTLLWRSGGGGVMGLTFFMMMIALLPFVIGPDLVLLAQLGGGFLWLAALLTHFLTLDRLLAIDAEDGTLEQYALSPYPMEIILLVKLSAHWVGTMLPLIVSVPLAGLLLNLSFTQIWWTGCALLIGTPALSGLGLIAASLTLNLRRAEALVALLIMPLSIPVMIFGISATQGIHASLTICAGLSLASIVLAITAARITLNQSEWLS